MDFGKQLKKRIDELGMTQESFAKKCGLTNAAISQIINGKRDPSLKSIVKILKHSSCSFEELTKG
jgi:transcriptional regulator with XRE-family HTH domain